jgi:hypothetical protein
MLIYETENQFYDWLLALQIEDFNIKHLGDEKYTQNFTLKT